MKKTTRKDFEEFKKHCEFYLNKLNLKNWEVAYGHKELKDSNAEVITDLAGYCATINLGLEVYRDLKIIALHEVLHIFFL